MYVYVYGIVGGDWVLDNLQSNLPTWTAEAFYPLPTTNVNSVGVHLADRTVRSDTQQHVLARATSRAHHMLSVVEGYAPVTVAHVLRFPAIRRHHAGDVLLEI